MFGLKNKILIIDDDNAFRDILRYQLSKDYEIIQASNGEEGLKSVLECRPDLVLLDLQMPDTYGFNVLEKLRKHPDQAIANTKVIIFSNQTSNQDRLLAKGLSVSGYLVKSDTGINDLKGIISEIFQGPIKQGSLREMD